jgi:hypothetical protein
VNQMVMARVCTCEQIVWVGTSFSAPAVYTKLFLEVLRMYHRNRCTLTMSVSNEKLHILTVLTTNFL